MPSETTGSKHTPSTGGQTTPHGIGKTTEADPGLPREDKAEPASGPRRDPLPTEYRNEGSDLPGLRKKLR
jgi:hypothetical protein